MSAPGWYPDPDGSPRLRYFDGKQWTANTADPPPSTSPHGYLPGTPPAQQSFQNAGSQQTGYPGSEFYNTVDPVATVGNAARAPEGDAVAVSVDVAVQAVEDVNSDLLYAMAIKKDEVMHVLISTVPDKDRVATDVVGAVVADVRLR